MKAGTIKMMTSTIKNKQTNLEYLIELTLKARINKAQDDKETFKACPAPYSQYSTNRLGQAKGPSGKILKQKHNNAGYLVLQVTKDNNKSTTITVSRLVALTWLPNKDGLSDVDHMNENLDDNCVDNLRWLSHSDNLRRREHKGGKRAVIAYNLISGKECKYKSMKEAALACDLSYSTVRGLCTHSYTLPVANSFTFRFEEK
ncbi:hypothetical protein ABC653_08860 [Lacticaseibacillus paracasei]|uniref:hypothetical protein n=1 Tax=Lacticaseibacillus paracasei TaxID=1597 RepID=UPI0031DC8138